MRPPRQVRKLSEAEVRDLDQVYRVTNSADRRTRCQIILLSHEGSATSQIATLVRFREETVLRWIDRLETEGVAGLEDRPRAGRPPQS